MSQTGNEISFLPIQELSTGRNTWDWIPLNLFLLCANEKKKKEKKKKKKNGWKFHGCQTLPLPNRIPLRGAGIYSMSER